MPSKTKPQQLCGFFYFVFKIQILFRVSFMVLALIRVFALYKLKTYSKWPLSMSIALFKCNDEVTQKTVSSMLEKYIIT